MLISVTSDSAKANSANLANQSFRDLSLSISCCMVFLLCGWFSALSLRRSCYTCAETFHWQRINQIDAHIKIKDHLHCSSYSLQSPDRRYSWEFRRQLASSSSASSWYSSKRPRMRLSVALCLPRRVSGLRSDSYSDLHAFRDRLHQQAVPHYAINASCFSLSYISRQSNHQQCYHGRKGQTNGSRHV